MKSSKKWKDFERLVTAIHIAEQQGAEVKWDEKINGRQFDVTIRFSGGLYNYLTVIECKDYKNPVPAEKVDALVTKANDAGADKAVMVASSGYQKAAIDVARRHNVGLLTLRNLQTSSAEKLAEQLTPLLVVCDFRFQLAKEHGELVIPEEPGSLRMFMRDLVIATPSGKTTPEQIVYEHLGEAQRTADVTPQRIEVPMPNGTTLIHPNTGQVDVIASFSFEYYIVVPKDRRALERLEALGLGVDPYLTASAYSLDDITNERTTIVDASRLSMGFDTVLEPGKFYRNPNLESSYYCESAVEDEVDMCLVESYQNGALVQAQFTASTEYSNQYVEVIEPDEIKRLAGIYERYKSLP